MGTLSAEDELKIRALVARYHDANSRDDGEQWGATWATDGQWVLGQQTVVGREAIVEKWRQIHADYNTRLVQLVCHGWVESSPGGAEGRWTFMDVFRRAREDHDHIDLSCFIDSYVQEDGLWVFAKRRFKAMYRGEHPAGEFYPGGPLDPPTLRQA